MRAARERARDAGPFFTSVAWFLFSFYSFVRSSVLFCAPTQHAAKKRELLTRLCEAALSEERAARRSVDGAHHAERVAALRAEHAEAMDAFEQKIGAAQGEHARAVRGGRGALRSCARTHRRGGGRGERAQLRALAAAPRER